MPPVYATFYAYQSPLYKPAMRLVNAITNDTNAAVTTTFDHGYITGTIVRMYVPFPQFFGMPQMDQKIGTITVTGDDTFTININSTDYEPFTYVAEPPVFVSQAPMVVPIGEANDILTAAVKNSLR